MPISPEFDSLTEVDSLAIEEGMDLFLDREPHVLHITDGNGRFESTMVVDGVSYPHFRDAPTTKRINDVRFNTYPSANFSALLHVLMQKGLIISGGDDHQAMTYNGSNVVDTHIPIYYHPDIERASEEDDEYESGENLLVRFMNCMEDAVWVIHGGVKMDTELLSFAEIREAFDKIIMLPEFSRIAPIVERHWRRVTSLGSRGSSALTL